MSKTIAIVNTQPPFGHETAKEAMDLALIFGSYEQDTHLYFKGQGVLQLVHYQDPSKLLVKDFLKTFSAFEFYDLENIYVCLESLQELGMSEDFHIEGVQMLNKTDFEHSVKQHNNVLVF